MLKLKSKHDLIERSKFHRYDFNLNCHATLCCHVKYKKFAKEKVGRPITVKNKVLLNENKDSYRWLTVIVLVVHFGLRQAVYRKQHNTKPNTQHVVLYNLKNFSHSQPIFSSLDT